MALAIVFALSWLIQFVILLVLWQRPLRHARKLQRQAVINPDSAAQQPGVSILVHSRNAGESLARNIPLLMSQDYPQFEVIVLDDDSLDETQDVVTMLEQRYDNFYHTRIDKRTRAMSHRKLGVLLGAKASHYDLLVMTHAECKPESDKWLAEMVRPFANHAIEVVQGPVVYERRQSLLSRFCQFDLFQRLLMLLGITLAVRPYAGWGQNMAFRKRTFYANGSQGYQTHLNIQPGEDDLFVANVGHDGNVAVQCAAASVMTDQSKPLFINWSLQRLDRAFTSRLYAFAPALVKWTDYVTRYMTVLAGLGILAYTLYIIICVNGVHPVAWTVFGTALLLLLIRMALIIYTFVATARMLKQRPYVFSPILLDLYMPWVDVWFRVKALSQKKRFGVGRIGLQ